MITIVAKSGLPRTKDNLVTAKLEKNEDREATEKEMMLI